MWPLAKPKSRAELLHAVEYQLLVMSIILGRVRM